MERTRLFHLVSAIALSAFLISGCREESTLPKLELEIVTKEFVYEPGPFPSCHASTVVETKEGELLAAFFGGEYEGCPDCCIWLCRRSGNGWSAPEKVADGVIDGVKTACYNPVLYQIPDGDLLLFYKVGECVQAWKGFLIRSSDGGRTWSAPVQLPDDFLGPVKNKPYLTGDRLLCGSSLEKGGWRVYIEETDLNCTEWKKTPALNDMEGPVQVIQPTFLHQERDGVNTLKILCRSNPAGEPIMASESYDEGRTWSEMIPTALPGNNSGIDGLTLADGRHLLVYNHPADSTAAARTPLVVAVSSDMTNWIDVLTLESTLGAEFSYPSVIQDHTGIVHIVYTDRRTRIAHIALKID